jgi:hypothetical protein
MIKFIITAIIIFLIILFWNKISDVIYTKFDVKINYLLSVATLFIIAIILLLVKN